MINAMYSPDEAQLATLYFTEYFTGKAPAKADVKKYLKNQLQLVKDDIIDVIEKKLPVVRFESHNKPNTGLLVLDKNEKIPEHNIVWYDGMVGYAAEMGITLTYSIEYNQDGAVVRFNSYVPPTAKITHNTMGLMVMTMTDEAKEEYLASQEEKKTAHAEKVKRFQETGEFVNIG